MTAMYHRRKLLLSLLESMGGNVAATDFQKLLFLLTRELSSDFYEFVPYKYGCFSFQSYYDKRVLSKYGILADDEGRWVLGENREYPKNLNERERNGIRSVVKKYGSLPGRDLLRYVYSTCPYYAINSEIAIDLLTDSEYRQVAGKRNRDTGTAFFTIGYEGTAFEHYLNRLIRNNVSVVCDVRKNPISMKYGFSKKQLKDTLSKLSIGYAHFPELGIDTDKRKDLHTGNDYKKLFTEYADSIVAQTNESISAVYELLKSHRRIALTCFEADHERCHRSVVAQKVVELAGKDLAVCHI